MRFNMKNIREKSTKLLTALLMISTLFLMTPGKVQAQTQAWTGICVSKVDVDGVPTDTDVATIQGFQCLIANVLASFLTLIGIASFVMLIIASFQWMTAGGNSQTLEKAKKTITFAILGIVLALSAFIILNLISEFTGVESIKTFKIPTSDTPRE